MSQNIQYSKGIIKQDPRESPKNVCLEQLKSIFIKTSPHNDKVLLFVVIKTFFKSYDT